MPLSVKYGLDQHAPNLALLGGDAVCGQRTLIVEFEGIYEFEIPKGVHPGVRLEGRLAAEGLQPSPAAAPSGGGDGAAGSAPSGALALPPLPDDGDEEIEELE
uniref:Uncharacterized protein n=1 Tax=Chlamydomonas leiostraca TaxID=1034604 RepID=A0A7S0R3W0_9CHLO|mmetsp:Transcript_13295/g.32482  ORF Transcript_13295/g.32482 Transcript_13295/m.32482 type:complete len:103 (+) Transcript_13295:408-716(+)